MPLGAVALRKRIEVEDAQGLASIPIIEKISFGGIISITEPEDRIDYRGRLFWAETGDLIYSKIRVKQGSLAIVPAEIKRIAVSAEYPVYTIRTGHAVPDYLELVLRTRSFLQLLDGLAHGGSTKTRIPPEDFERQDIPVPPLETQRAIVARWQTAQTEADAAEERVRQVEAEINARFLADLGLKLHGAIDRPRVLAIRWKQLDKWGVRQTTDVLLGLDHLPSGNYPLIPIGDVSNVSYGIQKSPANRPGEYARPYLRVANVRKGYLDLGEIKEINVLDSEMDAYRLEPGDILFVEGNGSRAELGRVAIWNDEIPNCVHQNHLIKVRIDQGRLLPEFAMHWFNTEIGRGHFFRSAKTSSGLGTINSQEVRSAPIPLPPLDVQHAIVERVQTGRAEIARLRADVERVRRAARTEVEALILGTVPIGNRPYG
jgi:type I restriction enzyme, S subunit